MVIVYKHVEIKEIAADNVGTAPLTRAAPFSRIC